MVAGLGRSGKVVRDYGRESQVKIALTSKDSKCNK